MIRDRVVSLRQMQCKRLAELPDETEQQKEIRREVRDFISCLDVVLDGN